MSHKVYVLATELPDFGISLRNLTLKQLMLKLGRSLFKLSDLGLLLMYGLLNLYLSLLELTILLFEKIDLVFKSFELV